MFIRQHVKTMAPSLALCFAVTILASMTAHCAEQQAELATSELSCEYATNPLGVDTPRPRFGWLLKSEQRAQLQSAYRVLVATSEKQLQANVGDKWDSGKVNSEQSVNVDYQRKALTSGETCYWKVKVWPALSKVEGDKQGQPSTWSKPGSFEMGLMKQSDWKGQWIGIAAANRSPLLCCHRRRCGSLERRRLRQRSRRIDAGIQARRLLHIRCRVGAI